MRSGLSNQLISQISQISQKVMHKSRQIVRHKSSCATHAYEHKPGWYSMLQIRGWELPGSVLYEMAQYCQQRPRHRRSAVADGGGLDALMESLAEPLRRFDPNMLLPGHCNRVVVFPPSCCVLCRRDFLPHNRGHLCCSYSHREKSKHDCFSFLNSELMLSFFSHCHCKSVSQSL